MQYSTCASSLVLDVVLRGSFMLFELFGVVEDLEILRCNLTLKSVCSLLTNGCCHLHGSLLDSYSQRS